MIRRRSGARGHSQYRHVPNAARKRREEIRKRARPYAAILSDVFKDETVIPKNFCRGVLKVDRDHAYDVLLFAKSVVDATRWMTTVKEEGFHGWDNRGNLLHISPYEIMEIRVYYKK